MVLIREFNKSSNPFYSTRRSTPHRPIFPGREREIVLNPPPKEFRLPGDKSIERQSLPSFQREQAALAWVMTWREYAKDLDGHLKGLPSNERLNQLSGLQKHYLSFLAYSLDQMVAAKTIGAETTWTIFNGQWEQLEQTDPETFNDDNFNGMRQVFMREVFEEVKRHNGRLRFWWLKMRYFSKGAKIDWTRFELLARGGRAGLDQYDRFTSWAQAVAFDPFDNLSEAVKNEYRKALWLEMRIVEGQIGLNGLNADISKFMYSIATGRYYQGRYRMIEGAISLFKEKVSSHSPPTLFSTIKSETGHWMFGYFFNGSDVLAEMMDRFNLCYSERIVDALTLLFSGIQVQQLPPEARVFIEGGFFSAVGDYLQTDLWPTYPDAMPLRKLNFMEAHLAAEYFDDVARKTLILRRWFGNVSPKAIYKTYRRLPLYILLLRLQQKITIVDSVPFYPFDSLRAVDAVVRGVKVAKVTKSYKFWRRGIFAYLERMVENRDVSVNKMAGLCELLLMNSHFGKTQQRRGEFLAFILARDHRWEELEKLKEDAYPVMRMILQGFGYDEDGSREKICNIAGRMKAEPLLNLLRVKAEQDIDPEVRKAARAAITAIQKPT